MDDSKTKVILALDVESRTKAESILEATGENLQWVKIGLQTYLRDGPEFLHDVASSGKSIFLEHRNGLVLRNAHIPTELQYFGIIIRVSSLKCEYFPRKINSFGNS